MIKTILWDVDGTLLDFKKSEKISLQNALTSIGYTEFDDELVERYSVINLKYWQMLERGEIEKAKLLSQRFDEFFALEGIDYEDTVDFNHRYHEGLSKYFFFNDNAMEVLRGLVSKVKQYIVTNGTANVQDEKLVVSGLDKAVDGIFISERVGYEKPAVEFFNFVREKTGYDPETTIIVGDSLTSDIKGGNNAGIYAVWYNPYKLENSYDITVDKEITDLREILELVK